eukprot:CAMPEP_0115105258 /NCGR_PEP_ID=MMETSP0227-20121206/35861_1 /TAXON_ID=89957 /ORGANISM="Polarella glacialis, Strain CCMP 1383" /LENGTH=35 /DNA_ID= /DNA_START= /DNA_END= /DNA_ORIENTATION=
MPRGPEHDDLFRVPVEPGSHRSQILGGTVHRLAPM